MRIERSTAVATLLALPLIACTGGGGGGKSDQPASAPRLHVQVQLPGGEVLEEAGLTLYVDGLPAGTTDASGTATLEGTKGEHLVRVLEPFSLGAGGTFEFRSSSPLTADLVLTGQGAELRTEVLDSELADGLVSDVAELPESLLLTDEHGLPLTLESFLAVSAQDTVLADRVPADAYFELGTDGRLEIVDPEGLLGLIGAFPNGAELNIVSFESRGFVVDHVLPLRAAQESLVVHLQGPTNGPVVPTTGVALELSLIGTEFGFEATTDELGQATFAGLPKGSYDLRADVHFEDESYLLRETVLVLGATDVVGVLQSFAGGGESSGLLLTGGPHHQDAGTLGATRATLPVTPRETLLGLGDGGEYGSASVVSAGEGQVIVDVATVEVPSGVTTVKLEYEVQSDEYPYYVLSQSIFNDRWSVGVYDDAGGELYYIARNVNSQLYTEPIWNNSGSTGPISATLQLPDTGSATTLHLRVTSTNVGDSILPTYVDASLGGTEFEILEVEADTVQALTSCGAHTKPQKEQSAYSIPWSPDTNAAERTFDLVLAGRPEDSTLSRVRCDLLNAATGDVLATLLDEGPSGGAVEELEFEILRVRITADTGHPSPVGATSPPPAGKIQYRFEVEVNDAGETATTPEKSTSSKNALWRKPPGIPRTSCEDTGHDDWTERSTWVWLSSHSPLLTRVGDISGEHGRNIGHSTHRIGREIDFFQYYEAAASSGSANYRALAQRFGLALEGSSQAEDQLKAAIEAERSGLDALTASGPVPTPDGSRSVHLVYSGMGGQVTNVKPEIDGTEYALPVGWLRDLRETGTATVGPMTLDLEIGTWANGMVTPYPGHNDHHHVVIR